MKRNAAGSVGQKKQKSDPQKNGLRASLYKAVLLDRLARSLL